MSDDRYKDDPAAVPDHTPLLRRINAYFCDWNNRDENGRPRITTQAVQMYRERDARALGCPGPAMSFHAEQQLNSPVVLFQQYPDFGFARIQAGEVRTGGTLGLQPWPTNDHPEHVVAFPKAGLLPKSEKKRLALILANNWVRVPPPPS